MKKAFVLTMMLMPFTCAYAQLEIPALSPPGKLVQRIGFTTFEVDYERPAARGRSSAEIFGKLVPFGKVWRTGAGEGTTISFDTDVTIGKQVVRKGKYALFTIPDSARWTIILNSDTLPYASFRHDEKKDVAKVVVPVQRSDRYYEALTIDIDFVPNNARIYISWLNTQVSFDALTGLDEKIVAFIHDNLISRDSDNPDLYESAIVYYLWHRLDRKQLMKFIDRGIALKKDRIWYYWKIEELLKDKRYAEARTAAETAISIIRNSAESPERKAELIRDFENYQRELKVEEGR